MTPRERVLVAFRHEVPDIVPAYVRNIMEWQRHAEHFGVSTQDELFSVLGNTIRSFRPDFLTRQEAPPDAKPEANAQLEFAIWGTPEEAIGTYTDSISRPLTHMESPSEVDTFNWPSGNDWDFDGMRDQLVAEGTHARHRRCRSCGMYRNYESPLGRLVKRCG